MPQLDIYKNPQFGLTTLTKKVNEMPFVPGQAGSLGIWEEEGVHTTTIEVENQKGKLVLVPTSPRGSAATPLQRDRSGVRYFKIPRLAVQSEIFADEIQDRRAFGAENELDIAQRELDRRAAKMNKALDATVEYGRIGAIKGLILDSDGSTTLYNLFTEFGVTQQTLDFVLGTTTTDMLSNCTDTRGMIQDELGQDGGDDLEVVAFCGATFWKRFISHTAVKDAYKFYQSVQESVNPLHQDLRYKGFKFGGITWKQYRGTVSGVAFVAASEAYAFPVNAPDLWISRYAPADYMETANTEGLPRYAKQAPDPSGFNRFVQLETQTNPLSLLTRPRTSIKLTTSN